MKKNIIIASVAVLFLLVACKGRTNDNVEPTGDTVEVVVDSVTKVVTDSVTRVVVDTVQTQPADSI